MKRKRMCMHRRLPASRTQSRSGPEFGSTWTTNDFSKIQINVFIYAFFSLSYEEEENRKLCICNMYTRMKPKLNQESFDKQCEINTHFVNNQSEHVMT